MKKFNHLWEIIWSLLLLISLALYLILEFKSRERLAHSLADVHLKKDFTLRQFVSKLGGVYAYVTPDLQPNPYLKNIKDRDINLANGKVLTLINPAYFLRLYYELYISEYKDVIPHLTSLKLKNPINAPDEWELKALKIFESSDFSKIDNFFEKNKIRENDFYRFIVPIKVDKSCLKCHGDQGYKEGDLRGGLSINILSDTVHSPYDYTRSLIFILHLSIWVVGIVIGFYFKRQEKKHSEEKDLLQRQLIHSSKLASIGELSSGLSHEIRGPLSEAYARAEYFNIKLGNDPAYQKIIEEQMQALERLRSISEGLFSYSNKNVDAKLKKENIHLIISDTLNFMNDILVKHKVEILFEKSAKHNYSFIQEGHLQQVLINLITNAIDSIEKAENGRIVIHTYNRDSFIIIDITDNGRGISPDLQKRIFEPFFTTKKAGNRTGMGLSVSKTLIESMGGALFVKSSEGNGSTFSIELKTV